MSRIYSTIFVILCAFSSDLAADGAPQCTAQACITFGENAKNNTSFYFTSKTGGGLNCWFNVDGWRYRFKLNGNSKRYHLKWGYEHTQVLWRCNAPT